MKEKFAILKNGLTGKAIVGVAIVNSLALPLLAAEEGEATTAMLTEFTSLKGQAITAMTAIVGLAVGIFGFKWTFKTVKSFFKSSTAN